MDDNTFSGSVLTYFAGFMAYCQDVNWMHIGAAILLVARLVHDVPKAWQTIKDYTNKKGNTNAE